MEDAELKRSVECLLFITDRPLSVPRIAQVLGEEEGRVSTVVSQLRQEYEERGGVQILEIAEGFQMATRPAYADFVRKLYADKMTMRLSAAALETLSIIAYKQPITRAEIEDVRGVDVIAALETLLDKRLVKVTGRRESVGRPLLYGTTPEFMRHFGLKSLQELPPLDSFPANLPSPVSSEAPADAAASAPSETLAETAGAPTEMLSEDDGPREALAVAVDKESSPTTT